MFCTEYLITLAGISETSALIGYWPTASATNLASHTDVLKGSTRVPALGQELTRDEPLRMSTGRLQLTTLLHLRHKDLLFPVRKHN